MKFELSISTRLTHPSCKVADSLSATSFSPPCLNFGQRSLTWVASSMLALSVTTPSGRSLLSSSRKGTFRAPDHLTESSALTLIYRQALRYVIRNTSLPARLRSAAQLELSSMHCYTRPTQIKNRCVMGGTARSVLRAFRMGRVRLCLCRKLRLVSQDGTDIERLTDVAAQFQFRMHALAGNLPGVKKASW
jgi:ribosomal protein S14